MNIGFAQNIAKEKYRNGNFIGMQNDDIIISEKLSNEIFIEETTGNKYYYGGELSEITNKNNIKKIKIHSDLSGIPIEMFKDCTNLEEVSFRKHSRLTTIGERAFSGCTSLYKITIPKNVTTIGNNAFENVTNCELNIKAKTANNLGITNNDNYNNASITKNIKGGSFNVNFITMFIIDFNPPNKGSINNNGEKYEIKKAFDKWDMIMEDFKIEGYDGHKITVLVGTFTQQPDNNGGVTLGGASITSIIPNSNTYTYGLNFYTNAGYFDLNTVVLNNMYNNVYHGSNMTQLYAVSVHELGHVLGIGPYWKDNWFSGMDFNPPKVQYIESNDNKEYYIGINALREYKKYFDNLYINNYYINGNNLIGIPIEDNGGGGTESLHPEEGDEGNLSLDNRMINGIFHPGLDRELMTGWAENPVSGGEQVTGMSVPLSRITIGFVEDLGFYVNYDEGESYLNQ